MQPLRPLRRCPDRRREPVPATTSGSASVQAAAAKSPSTGCRSAGASLRRSSHGDSERTAREGARCGRRDRRRPRACGLRPGGRAAAAPASIPTPGASAARTGAPAPTATGAGRSIMAATWPARGPSTAPTASTARARSTEAAPRDERSRRSDTAAPVCAAPAGRRDAPEARLSTDQREGRPSARPRDGGLRMRLKNDHPERLPRS